MAAGAGSGHHAKPMDLGPWERGSQPASPSTSAPLRLLDWFIPADRTDAARLARARVLVGGSAANVVALVPLIVQRWIADGGVSLAVAVSIIAQVVMAAVPFLLRWTRSHELAGAFAVASMFLLLSSLIVSNGGLDAGAVLFLPLPIIFGYFFAGSRFGLAVAVAVGLEVALLAWLHHGGYAFPPPPDDASKRSFVGAGLIATAFVLAIITWLYERELRRSASAVQTSERRYALAAQGANDVLWDWDLTRGTLEISPRLAEILGTDVPVLWERLHPDDRVALRDGLNRHLTDGEPCRVEIRLRDADGGWCWFDMRGQAVWDHAQHPLRMAGSLRDITSSKDAEAAIAAHARDLARSNAELEKFAYVASHDLSEPLRTVSSFSELLVRKYPEPADAEAEEYVRYIVGGAHRMRALITGLLAYVRVGKHEPPPEPIDCNALVADVVESLSEVIEERGAMVTYDALPTISGNPSALSQLFQNLIGNSIKFCDGPPRIEITAEALDGVWVLAVRDNGIGILPDMHERIFEIFQRLHGDEEYPGTGVGLSICKKIVERHDGRLWLESAPGEGSTFFVALPSGTV